MLVDREEAKVGNGRKKIIINVGTILQVMTNRPQIRHSAGVDRKKETEDEELPSRAVDGKKQVSNKSQIFDPEL